MRYVITRGTIDEFGTDSQFIEAVYRDDQLEDALRTFADMPYKLRNDDDEDDFEYMDETLYGIKSLYIDESSADELADNAFCLIACDECGNISYDSYEDIRECLPDILAAVQHYSQK